MEGDEVADVLVEGVVLPAQVYTHINIQGRVRDVHGQVATPGIREKMDFWPMEILENFLCPNSGRLF